MICLLPGFLIGMQGESSFPYLSGYTWAFFCDWRMLKEDYGSGPESFRPEDVQLGDTVFVDYLCLEEFGRDILPRIKDQVILITSNYGYGADCSMPGPYDYLLNEEKIAVWFIQNIDRAPSKKLIPIPIGIANKHWDHGNTNLFNQFIPISISKQMRSIFLYLNYTPHPFRSDCTDYFTQIGAKFEQPKLFGDYLKDLTEAVFVISPPGNGIDCHRTWEALLLGCYPVVKKTTLSPLYEGLPVVVVDDWSEVTQEFLFNKYRELRSQKWSREKLYAPYWFDQVRKIQNQITSPQGK